MRVPEQSWNSFSHCSLEDLDITNRIPKIIEKILLTMPDVVCLQEVVFEKYSVDDEMAPIWRLPRWTDALTERGFVGVIQGLSQKEFEKNASRNEKMVGRPCPTGVATFYRHDKFEEVAPAKHGSGSGTVLFLRSLERRDFCFAIGNTHLVGDPAKFDAHLKQLSGIAKNMSFQPGFARIICGDFNGECRPGSEVYSWMEMNGFADLDIGGSTWAEPGRGLHLDHILYEWRSFELPVDVLPPLDEEDILCGLPNSRCPSDHIPVSARLVHRQQPPDEFTPISIALG